MSTESHEEYAQRVYGIAPENLTKEQRDAVKAERFVEMYGLTPRGVGKLREVFSIANLDFSAVAKRFATPVPTLEELRKTTATPIQGNFARFDFRDAEVRILVVQGKK